MSTISYHINTEITVPSTVAQLQDHKFAVMTRTFICLCPQIPNANAQGVGYVAYR